jgi:hypothetical protein
MNYHNPDSSTNRNIDHFDNLASISNPIHLIEVSHFHLQTHCFEIITGHFKHHFATMSTLQAIYSK